MDSRSQQMRRNDPNPLLPTAQPDDVKMFVFSDLPPEEKDRFMDFLVQNNVDFAWDTSDQTYVATIKIVNQP